MKPRRGLLLVKPVDTEEKLGSVVLIADTRERMTLGQCEVIAVGEPAYCIATRSRAERKCQRQHVTLKPWDSQERVHPCSVQRGDWLLCRPRAFIDGPEPERKEWFVHQDDVIAILGRGEAP